MPLLWWKHLQDLVYEFSVRETPCLYGRQLTPNGAGIVRRGRIQIKSNRRKSDLISNQIKSSNFWESSNEIKSWGEKSGSNQIRSNQIMIWFRFQIRISGVTKTNPRWGWNEGFMIKYGTDRKLSASSFYRCHCFHPNRWFELKNASIMIFKSVIKSNQIMGKGRQIKSNQITWFKKCAKSNQIKSNHVI